MSKVKVFYHKDNIHSAYNENGKRILFSPGLNLIEKEDMTFLLENKIFKARVDHGDFEISEKEINVAKKSIPEVKKMIEDIWDIKVLKDIKASDMRKAVITAVDEQVSKIKYKKENNSTGE